MCGKRRAFILSSWCSACKLKPAQGGTKPIPRRVRSRHNASGSAARRPMVLCHSLGAADLHPCCRASDMRANAIGAARAL